MSKRLLLMLACSVSVCAIILFSTAHSFIQVVLSYFIINTAGTFAMLVPLKLATEWFGPHKLASVSGLVFALGSLGGIVAQTPLILVIDHFGWRTALLLDGFLGVLIFMFITAFVEDREKTSKKAINLKMLFKKTHQALKKATSNRQNWTIGIYVGLINLPFYLLGNLWGNRYLVQSYGIKPELASLVIVMLFLGILAFSQGAGFLSDFFKTRKMPLRMSSLLGLIAMVVLLFQPSLSITALFIIFLFIGATNAIVGVALALVKENNPPQLSSSAQGFTSTLSMALGMILQPLFSWLIEVKWNHMSQGGIPLYSMDDYHRAMSMFPIAFLVAFCMTFFLKVPKK